MSEPENDDELQFDDGDNEHLDPDYNANNENQKSPDGSPKTKKPRQKQKSYKKKVERQWNDTDITNLIKEIETRRLLWDVGAPEYKLPKESLWQEVADTVSASVNDCKAKWGNLRVSFNSNLNKYRKKKSGQGTDESYTVTWKFFKAMMFLEASKLSQSTQSTSSMPLVKLFNQI